ncbi:hypothetical protein HOC80_00130 [archaeon]|jgi:23S rRNA G2445 N2-methylase RlmL|nr:hypothetical protein [archaeon]MBT4416491.1 hypothetical protein [archaeon]
MKYVCIVPIGLEDQALKELKGEKILPGRILCDKVDVKKVQSVIKVYEYWGQGKVDNFEAKERKFKGTVKVSCHRNGEHDFTSQDVEKIFGQKLGCKVDYKSPDEVVFVDVLNGDYLYGLDLSPKLLSKRDYRIKIHNKSVNACVAYCLVRMSGWDGEGMFLDPFCKDGIICIEAMRFKSGKVRGYDSLFHNVRSAEINSKLAELKIKFARMDVDWLQTKFRDDEVDYIVSAVPYPSKRVPENRMVRLYKDFFSALEEVLGKRAVFFGPNLELFKELCPLKLVEERQVFMGKSVYSVVVYEK